MGKKGSYVRYDVIIGAGQGGIFAAYELMKQKPDCRIAVFEEGYSLDKRRCPIDEEQVPIEKFEDNVRTFCMNPNNIVINENTNGIITVNGHSYERDEKKTANTNFVLLVEKHFSEPFKDSKGERDWKIW